MTASDFAKTYSCDADWVAAMSDTEIPVFTQGQSVTYCGFAASIVRHYANGMWEIRVPGGVTCVSFQSFTVA
jgi:hypothetical protein